MITDVIKTKLLENTNKQKTDPKLKSRKNLDINFNFNILKRYNFKFIIFKRFRVKNVALIKRQEKMLRVEEIIISPGFNPIK